MTVTLSEDAEDVERTVSIVFDNVSLALIEQMRVSTNPLDAKIDMILASMPDDIQISIPDLKIRNVIYDAQTIKATLYVDDILNTGLPDEKYTPSSHPGLF